MTKRLRVSVDSIDGDNGCYDLRVTPHGYGIRLEDESGEYVDVTLDMWLALVAAVCIEDVPEPKTPGRRLAQELREEGLGAYVLPSSPKDMLSADDLERVAARLGIKPEGE